MDVTFEGMPDPHYYPLPPSIDDVLIYASELEAEGRHISFEWAHNEIKNHLLSYVRVGLVAHRVKLYKLYRHATKKIKTFRDYCENHLGKSSWYVNRLIEAARVVLDLVKAGFTVLPQCEAQARPLTKFFGEELTAKWQEVVDSIPAHRMTANAVAAVVDGEPEHKNRQVKVDGEVWSELLEKAAAAGMSPTELLKQLVQEYEPNYEPEPEETPEETPSSQAIPSSNHALAPITAEELAVWRADVEQLIIEHFGLANTS